MDFTNTQVINFKGAFRGLRNPLNSWHKSDSFSGLVAYEDDIYLEKISSTWIEYENDRAIKNGEEPLEAGSNAYLLKLDAYMAWLEKEGILQQDEYGSCAEVFYIGPADLQCLLI